MMGKRAGESAFYLNFQLLRKPRQNLATDRGHDHHVFVANAGQITSIVGTARQWQFGAKVDF